MSKMFSGLSAPFSPSEVDWRVGSTTKDKSKGMALAYLDARAVMARLDAVCGPAGWQNRYVMDGKKTVCELGIKCGDDWIWKADGAGDSDIEAEKGALSDAFKRAGVRWGIGRYLYDVSSPWVELESRGNSFIIAPHERARLDKLLTAAPVQNTQRDPNASLQKAKEWTNTAIKQIGELKNEREADDWYAAFAGHMAKLKSSAPDEGAQVTAALKEQRASFKPNVLAAG